MRTRIQIYIALGCLLLASCGDSPVAPAQTRSWQVQAPGDELVVTVFGQVGHREAESVKAPVEGLRLAWLASEGSLVEAGEVIARYDTELLELWLRANEEDLAVLQRQVRAADLAANANSYELRAKLEDAEADARATRLAYELSKEQDEAERAILQRELEQARETLDAATEKLDALKKLVALGATALAEVHEAMAAYERALAKVRIPEIKLKDFDRRDGSEQRMLLDQDLAKLGLKLEGESQAGTLRSRLAVAITEHAHDLRRMDLREQQLADSAEDVSEVIDDAVHRVETEGVIGGSSRHSLPLVAGAELGGKQLTEVLSPETAIIEVTIPELMREAVQGKGAEGYQVRARIPSLDERWLAGRLQSVSLVKQNEQGVKPAYAGVVLLDETPANLSFGAGVECEVRIPVPAGAVVIPCWWATKGFRPLVRLMSGEERVLEAQTVGDWLLVSEGLSVGERLLPPERQSVRNTVLYATTEAPDREEIKLAQREPWNWRIEERIDDGTVVEAGQVIARVRRASTRKTRANEAEIEELKADAARFLARSSANGKLGSVYMDWQAARIDAETARLKYLIARQDVDDVGMVQGQVNARLASIQRKQVEDDVQRESAVVFDEIRSANQRARALLDLRVVQMREAQSDLAAVGATNYRKSVDLWAKREAWQRSRALADAAVQAYRRGQITHRNRLALAESQYEKAMLEVDTLRKDASQGTLTAPISGRLFHNNRAWNSIDIGDRVRHRHLFNIPTSNRREFVVHLPSRLYRDFAVADELPFFLPAAGMKRHTGHIVHIADFFEKRERRKSAYSRNRHTVVTDETEAESTVRVRVEFEAESILAVPPGMTVVIELDGEGGAG
jgi:multidrug efflux pump subunit AcrA (membrane-fusion protein)